MGKPDSKVYICSGVRLNSKYEHSIYFPSVDAQRAYFASKVVYDLGAVSYVRRFWDLKVDATMDTAKNWNYLYVINAENPTEYQYYFINNIEYNNEHSVILKLELDVIQTYLLKCELLPCFIERQHTTTDTVGSNTIDEGLETGEYMDLQREDFLELEELAIFAMSTINLETFGGVGGKMLNGTYQRCGTYMCEKNNFLKIDQTMNQLNDDESTDIEGIVTMFMFPKCFAGITNSPNKNEYSAFSTVSVNAQDEADPGVPVNPVMRINMPTTLPGGYAPRNKKLLTYPFNFIYVTNNNGSAGVYKYEEFAGKEYADFRARGAIAPDGGVKLIPLEYRGVSENADHALTLSGYPTCAWSSDDYKIWLAQNMRQTETTLDQVKTNTSIGVVGGLATAVAGLAMQNYLMAGGGVTAAISSGISGFQKIESMTAQRQDRSIQPPQAKGSISSNTNLVNGCMTFSFYKRAIRNEYAKIIDDYFSLYGYKINRVQKPNVKARTRYTYVKTAGCHVAGNLNNADLSAIENIFNNGITFWVDGDEVGRYADERGHMLNNSTL